MKTDKNTINVNQIYSSNNKALIKKSIQEAELKLSNLKENDPQIEFYKNILKTQQGALKDINYAESLLAINDEQLMFRKKLSNSMKRGNIIFITFFISIIILSLLGKFF